MRLALALVAALALAAPAAAQTSSAFLPLSGGARAYGMGGTAVALVGDAGAVFWNPARLAFVEGTGFTAGYARLAEGLAADRFEFALALPLGENVAAPLQRGRVARTALGLGLDYLGLDLAEGSRYWEGSASLSAAWAPINFGALGLTVRVLAADSDLDEVSARGAALDAGFTLALHPRLEGALVARNLLGEVEFNQQGSENLNRTTTAALAWLPREWLTAAADLRLESDEGLVLALGAEARVANLLAVRAGLSQWIEPATRSVPAAGLGLAAGRFALDYGVQFDEDDALGVGHRVTVGGSF